MWVCHFWTTIRPICETLGALVLQRIPHQKTRILHDLQRLRNNVHMPPPSIHSFQLSFARHQNKHTSKNRSVETSECALGWHDRSHGRLESERLPIQRPFQTCPCQSSPGPTPAQACWPITSKWLKQGGMLGHAWRKNSAGDAKITFCKTVYSCCLLNVPTFVKW